MQDSFRIDDADEDMQYLLGLRACLTVVANRQVSSPLYNVNHSYSPQHSLCIEYGL
jgi:hypothetical protein